MFQPSVCVHTIFSSAIYYIQAQQTHRDLRDERIYSQLGNVASIVFSSWSRSSSVYIRICACECGKHNDAYLGVMRPRRFWIYTELSAVKLPNLPHLFYETRFPAIYLGRRLLLLPSQTNVYTCANYMQIVLLI